MLTVIGWILFGLVLALALPLQVLGLPGTWLILADAAAARLVAGNEPIGGATVAVLGIMALTGEAVEFLASASGAAGEEAARGTTVAAILGAFAGGLLGAPILFGLGAIPGMAAGAFLSVFLLNLAAGRDLPVSLTRAYGAFMGRLTGTILKLAIAAAMIAVVIVALVR